MSSRYGASKCKRPFFQLEPNDGNSCTIHEEEVKRNTPHEKVGLSNCKEPNIWQEIPVQNGVLPSITTLETH